MARVRILVTGATGYLGHHVRALADPARVEVVVAARAGGDAVLDLSEPTSVGPVLAAWQPDVVLHVAALSSLRACEKDPGLALQVNAHATAALCAGASRVVYASTDLVFAGNRAPYAPADPPRPLSVYGRTKARGEEAVLATARGVVVRLPLLFGRSFDGRRGATDMIRAAAAEGRDVALYVDEYRTPLHVADAARALLAVALDGGRVGVVHVAGRERVSRWDLGQRFVARAGVVGVRLVAAPSTDPLRPKDVSLRAEGCEVRSLDAALGES